MKSTVHPYVKGRANVQRHCLFDYELMHSFVLFGLLKKKFDILRNRQPTVVCNCPFYLNSRLDLLVAIFFFLY